MGAGEEGANLGAYRTASASRLKKIVSGYVYWYPEWVAREKQIAISKWQLSGSVAPLGLASYIALPRPYGLG